ncbi:MAG TPA: tautomerase family protein [Polyangia bacterium]|jgi:phenylpyruvate tautomerase PptA (4-oxalocrotonate tautomerase family)
MPIVKVYRRQGRPAEENRQILAGIHEALVAAFKIPDDDRNHLLFELDAAHLELPADRTAAYTLIEIAAFPGRSVDAKRALYAGIVERLGMLGVPASDVFVVLAEPPLECWSVRNGLASCDARPSFKLNV